MNINIMINGGFKYVQDTFKRKKKLKPAMKR